MSCLMLMCFGLCGLSVTKVVSLLWLMCLGIVSLLLVSWFVGSSGGWVLCWLSGMDGWFG